MKMDKYRAKNLDLIRWVNDGHKNTVVKLKRVITNGCFLSEMALGKTEISNYVARDIEGELKLPDGWLDRNNVSTIMTLSEIDYKLLEALRNFTEAKRKKVYELILNQ